MGCSALMAAYPHENDTLLQITTPPPHIPLVRPRQAPSHMGEAAPVPLQRHRQVITQSPSVHSVTVPTMTAQSW